MSPFTQFTQDSALDLLFDPALISAQVRNQIPQELHIRPLSSTDYTRGHLDVLKVLTTVTDPGESAWISQFNQLRSLSRTYYTLVIVDKATDQIVAVGTVFIERKFLRGLSSVGHIEDIAVDKRQQGKELELRVIQALTVISENSGCYKTILNCSDSNIPFYEKCGYQKENEMAKDAPERPHSVLARPGPSLDVVGQAKADPGPRPAVAGPTCGNSSTIRKCMQLFVRPGSDTCSEKEMSRNQGNANGFYRQTFHNLVKKHHLGDIVWSERDERIAIGGHLWTMTVELDGTTYGEAQGNIKAEAMEEAARLALEQLRIRFGISVN